MVQSLQALETPSIAYLTSWTTDSVYATDDPLPGTAFSNVVAQAPEQGSGKLATAIHVSWQTPAMSIVGTKTSMTERSHVPIPALYSQYVRRQ
jgi:hypothetical protein